MSIPYDKTTAQDGTLTPPLELSFWELFDYFWVRRIGNKPHADGTRPPWTATPLECVFDGSPDKRSIENWQSQANMPSPDNIRKLSWAISADDDGLRRKWYEALIAARLNEKRKERAVIRSDTDKHLSGLATNASISKPRRATRITLIAASALCAFGAMLWFLFSTPGEPAVANMRICDAPYFDRKETTCTQHVSVFVQGVEEVFLSFNFKNVPQGTPFDRWWILDGERIAGRTSFNDDAWPGYTYWRPGTLEIGHYVVRIVVAGKVFTQAFYVQPEGFIPEDN